jgi:hypothetical protein
MCNREDIESLILLDLPALIPLSRGVNTKDLIQVALDKEEGVGLAEDSGVKGCGLEPML